MQVPALIKRTLTIASNRNFESRLSIRCLVPQHICRFFIFANFAHYCVVLLNALLSDRDRQKGVCRVSLSPEKSWYIAIEGRRSRYPIGCGFRRRDNLLAWRELFANLYELKSPIWFWEEYNKFKRIYKVYRFVRFSSFFAKIVWE